MMESSLESAAGRIRGLHSRSQGRATEEDDAEEGEGNDLKKGNTPVEESEVLLPFSNPGKGK